MRKLFISLFIVLLCAAASNAAQKVVLVTGEWAPYTSEKMAGGGFFTEIVSAVFKEAGIEVEYKYYPWLRCESEVKSGTAFAAFPYKETSERKQVFDFSDGIFASKGKFFYLKNKVTHEIKWEKYEDLKVFKIGGTLGYWYMKDFEKAGLKPDYANDDTASIKKLQAGRVDIVPADELVGWVVIKKEFPSEAGNFATAKKPLNVDNLSLMISKSYPDSAAIKVKVNAALKKIKEKGIYSTILKKYGMSE